MIGRAAVVESEIKTILTGVKIAISKGFNKLVIESDSMVAVKYVWSGCSSQHPYFHLISSLKSLATSGSEVDILHILREANQVADGFAKHGQSL